VNTLIPRVLLAGMALLQSGAAPAPSQPPPPAPFLNEEKLPVSDFRVVERDSGPVMYYQVEGPPEDRHIHAEYKPPLETVTLGLQVPDKLHQKAQKLRWRWRALALPTGGNDCVPGRGDSAALVYVVWKSGLKYYVVKFAWAGAGRRGRSCRQSHNLFAAQDAVIQESGGPLGKWVSEEIDLKEVFRTHFRDGDPRAEVPDFVGVGLLTDGDQTRSESAAEYAGFSILY
jgi:hypothetical protein